MSWIEVFCPTDSSTATRLDFVLSFNVLSFNDKPYVLAGFNVVVEAVFFPLEDSLKGSVSWNRFVYPSDVTTKRFD